MTSLKHIAAVAVFIVTSAVATIVYAALAAPASLTATAISSSAINLRWIDTNSKESGYSIERSLSATSGWIVIGVVSRNVVGFQDNGLASSRTYYYRVQATGRSGSSPYSNVASATTSGGAVVLPTATAAARTTATVTAVRTATPIPTSTPIRTATAAPVVTATRTATPVRTATATVVVATRTATPVPTATRTVTPAPMPTATTSGTPGQVTWTQALGSNGTQGEAVAVDQNGNMLAAGSLSGSTNIGGVALTSAGSNDVFFAKYTATGSFAQAQRFGGTGTETALGAAMDAAGNTIVVGRFSGSMTVGTAALGSIGGTDLFIAKYSAAGAPMWAKRFGGVYDDAATAVAVEQDRCLPPNPSGLRVCALNANVACSADAGCTTPGNIVVTGWFNGSSDFGTGTLYSSYAGQDTFVAKFSPNGDAIWSRNFWNTSSDAGQGVAIDRNGDVAVAGWFTGAINFGNGTLTGAGGNDAYVAKLSGATGTALWSRSFGSVQSDDAYAVAVDDSGNVIVTGTFADTVDFGTGPITAAWFDGFVAKYTATGAPVWARSLTGIGGTKIGYGVAADTAGNVVVTGMFIGTLNLGSTSLTAQGYMDAFVVKYTAAGAVQWAQGFGGAGNNTTGSGVTIDRRTNDVVATGAFGSSASFGGAVLTSGGLDGYLVRLAH